MHGVQDGRFHRVCVSSQGVVEGVVKHDEKKLKNCKMSGSWDIGFEVVEG